MHCWRQATCPNLRIGSCNVLNLADQFEHWWTVDLKSNTFTALMESLAAEPAAKHRLVMPLGNMRYQLSRSHNIGGNKITTCDKHVMFSEIQADKVAFASEISHNCLNQIPNQPNKVMRKVARKISQHSEWGKQCPHPTAAWETQVPNRENQNATCVNQSVFWPFEYSSWISGWFALVLPSYVPHARFNLSTVSGVACFAWCRLVWSVFRSLHRKSLATETRFCFPFFSPKSPTWPSLSSCCCNDSISLA